MDKRWKNLAVVVILLAMAGAVYLSYGPTSPGTLEDNEVKIQEIWENNNVNLQSLDTTTVALLTDKQLLNAKNEFESMKSNLSGPSEKIVDIQLDIVGVIQKRRALLLQSKDLSNVKGLVVCSRLDNFKMLSEETVSLSAKIKQTTEKIADFKSQNSSSQLTDGKYFDIQKASDGAERSATAFAKLNAVCNGVGA